MHSDLETLMKELHYKKKKKLLETKGDPTYIQEFEWQYICEEQLEIARALGWVP